jgi:VanZ family protein
MEYFLKASLPSWLSGLFIVFVVPFFFVGGPELSSSLLLKNVWNFGHIVFFAVLMLLIQSFKPLAHWWQWLLVTLIAIAIGSLIEFAQYFVGRSSSVDDVLHNIFGVWLGLFWGQKPTRLIWLLRFISVLLIVPAMWLVVDSGIANFAMRNQFPLINSFESRYELQQVQVNPNEVTIRHANTWHTHGKYGLAVVLGTKKYAGVSLIGSYGDWSHYKFLVIDFYNPDAESLELVLRISDSLHDRGTNDFNDRFNRRILLAQGWSQVQVDLNDVRTAPGNRVMHMDAIGNMTIFAVQLSKTREFYVDNIRLQ